MRDELVPKMRVFPGLWDERGYERFEGGGHEDEGSRRGRVGARVHALLDRVALDARYSQASLNPNARAATGADWVITQTNNKGKGTLVEIVQLGVVDCSGVPDQCHACGSAAAPLSHVEPTEGLRTPTNAPGRAGECV